MPSRLDSPVLSLSINNISKIDTHNVDNLFGMWTIFSRCAESLENGRRLENLSWRLWNQETFYTGTVSKFRASAQDNEAQVSSSASTRSRASTSSTEDVPALSSSVESASSNDRYPHSSVKSDQSTLSRRGSGRERHINPVGLARLMSNLSNNEVEQMIEEHAKSPAKLPVKPIDVPVAVATTSHEADKSSTDSTLSNDSTDSQSSVKSSHSVVRGFGPGLVSNSYRSSTKLAPEVTVKERKQSDAAAAQPVKAKKGGMFIVGSSPSDASGSYEGSRYGSVLTNSLRRVVSTSSKRAAFVDEVQTRTIVNEEEDDDYITEDEDVSDSAIDEEDGWDSVSESGSSYTEENMFARIEEPRPQLPSRRSLLSTLLHQGDRAAALARAGTRSAPAIRSRTASPNGPAMPPSPIREAPMAAGARAVPMVKSASAFPQALSPRTTRRNMLATELTESLRKHLLWERQQKNKVANAVLRRRHTAYDMQNMTEYPQRQDRAGSWNNQFEHGGVNEYHLAGW
ncbi:hypothetical protein ABW20_dc0102253 [Dactylellina cionopaga]|nr:hypothetical protein ABW20_dc0102253 [Dactylellina cionopaga]